MKEGQSPPVEKEDERSVWCVRCDDKRKMTKSEITKLLWSRGVYNNRPSRKHSTATKLKISITKIGDKNPNWCGDNISYQGLHTWANRHLIKPDRCSKCQKIGWLDLANISQVYKRDLTDWEWLCRKCHMTKDGRLNRLINNNRIAKFAQGKTWKQNPSKTK